MFAIILHGFGMICMELPRTDVVFSRTTVVLFFVQKSKFSKCSKTFWWFFWNKREIMEQRTTIGGPLLPTRHQGAPEGAGTPWWVMATSWLFWPSHEASSASFLPKNSSKSFAAFGELWFLHKKQHHVSSAENRVSPGLFHYFLYFPEKFSVDFQRIPRTFISAQKQHHGNSAENNISPG